jgi:hypothetical protein
VDEQATFDPQAVLAPKRARRARIALVVPVIALAVTAWAGLSGRSDPPTAVIPAPSQAASPVQATGEVASEMPEATEGVPATALGLAVQRLVDIDPRHMDRDRVVALSGWYVPTAITNCPPLPALYRDGALPYLRGDKDTWAFCDRSGVLYASEPDLSDGLPTNNLEDNRSKGAGLPAVAASVVVGVVMPLELETVGEGATQVVVIGHFVPTGDGCGRGAGCRHDLVVDYLAWPSNA